MTVALITTELGVPEPRELRLALFGWAFNLLTATGPAGEGHRRSGLGATRSLPVAPLQDTATPAGADRLRQESLTGNRRPGDAAAQAVAFDNLFSSRLGGTASATSGPTTSAREDDHPGQGGVRVVSTASAIADCGKPQKSARKIGL